MTGGTEASGDRSVAAGGGIGRVNTGDYVTQVERATLLPAEALTLSASGLVHLPERTKLFVGRERELALLDEDMEPVQVICGLGGIGKSTLAARWAANRVPDHQLVWWITAETPAELDAGLAELARAMQPSVVGVLPEDALRERALQWLATHDGWLLVLDNVSDPADLRPLLARAGGGRILVTSRRASGWQDIGRTVALEVLGPGEAAELFRGVCDAADGLDDLCAELGYLPLALKQAAAYCAEAGITPRTYLELLAEYPAEMFAATAEGGEAARTLARVWQVTLDRLGDTPLAVTVLRVIAWWAPEGIPRWLLEPLGTPLEVTEAVRRLAAHSMITLRDGELAVHRLVQAVVRADLAEATVTARRLSTRLLFQVEVKEPPASDRVRRQVAVHAEALAACTDPDEDTESDALLFLLSSAYLGTEMAVSRALPLSVRAEKSRRRILGPDHPGTLLAAENVALHASFANEGVQAVELLTTALTERLRTLGREDPATLATRERLARTLRQQDPKRAEALLTENIADCERFLGAAHPQTIQSRYALLEARFGGIVEVAALEELVVAVDRAEPEDPDLGAMIKRDLIFALATRGEVERALALAAEVVEESRRRLGDHDARVYLLHLTTIQVLHVDGQTQRARALGAALLEDCLRVFGESEMTQLVRRMTA
ncbi:tetratricopeptide repeat protein [Streptomyces sp. NPDC026092]|uniref:tetratricopeptide repeat protein n=1 Tax=Streptomyces sp. NPDC026092 TaxID=3154797 RepID=UPI0033EEEEB6